jgi:hypothetical protein
MNAVTAAAVCQALGAIVSAVATVVLVRITARYANAADATLRVLEQERKARILAATLPAVNAIARVDSLIEMARAVRYANWNEVYDVREFGASHSNAVSHAASLVDRPLAKTLEELAAEAQRLVLMFPRTRGQYEPPATQGELDALRELHKKALGEQVARVREVQKRVHAATKQHVG